MLNSSHGICLSLAMNSVHLCPKEIKNKLLPQSGTNMVKTLEFYLKGKCKNSLKIK